LAICSGDPERACCLLAGWRTAITPLYLCDGCGAVVAGETPGGVYVSMPFCEWLVRVVSLTPYQANIEYHRIGCDPIMRYHLTLRLRT
jgi:hypothetical protein